MVESPNHKLLEGKEEVEGRKRDRVQKVRLTSEWVGLASEAGSNLPELPHRSERGTSPYQSIVEALAPSTPFLRPATVSTEQIMRFGQEKGERSLLPANANVFAFFCWAGGVLGAEQSCSLRHY